ncbi:MAG: type II toxin-antitoxin system RelE/ParE family toxin [bacterium]|jgi:putative addiction module killer protein
MKERELREYLTETGRNPFHDWLRALRDTQARARIRVRLNRVRLGNFGDCKPVGEGVLELRMDFGPGYRAYLGQDGETLVILLCGGDKQTQPRDIAKAKEYWTSYRQRTTR